MNPKKLKDLRESPEYVQVLDLVMRDRLEEQRVLPYSRVAEILGINERTVRRLVDTGALGHCRPTEGRVGVTQAQVIEYVRVHSYDAQAS